MTALELALGVAVLALAGAVLVLATRGGNGADEEILERSVERSVDRAIADMDLDRTAGEIETHAREMKAFHSDVERMLTNPQQRGSFGEVQLETILADVLPPDSYGLQEAIVDGNRPDAYVETAEGIVPIDAKFPLAAFERAMDAEDSTERAQHEREFARRVEDQLEKIATDYVRPDQGTTDVAFAFVPSERVYYHLLTEEYDLLRDHSSQGVQVVSPLTLGGKLRLLQAGVHAQRLSEEAMAVRKRLQRLDRRFESVADEWDTAMRHLQNALDRADDADRAFDQLRAEFDRIEGLSPEALGEDEESETGSVQ